MSTLERLIEEAEKIAGDGNSIVVWDSRDTAYGGTRLEIQPAPLGGYRAIMQDGAGICTSIWRPDCKMVEAAMSALDAYLGILNPKIESPPIYVRQVDSSVWELL